jgi:hypothetical protein
MKDVPMRRVPQQSRSQRRIDLVLDTAAELTPSRIGREFPLARCTDTFQTRKPFCVLWRTVIMSRFMRYTARSLQAIWLPCHCRR